MEPCQELRDLTLRLYQAISAGDVTMFERHTSHEPGVINIGGDPNEWWVGYDTFIRVSRAQLQEMGGSVNVTDANPQAFCEASVGWVADQPIFEFADGAKARFRLTFVFHKEDGEWKVVQSHNSVGVRNEDVVGRSLTVE